jgi:hypothetical protein
MATIRNDAQMERRRLGGGIVVTSLILTGGWFSASQSFVTKQNGQLVHPSPYTWFFWLLVFGIGAGVYITASTTWEWLLPAKWRPVDHSTMYSLAMEDAVININMNKNKLVSVGVKPGIQLINGGPGVIQYKIESMNAQASGKTVDNPVFLTAGKRLLPGHRQTYFFPMILDVPITSPIMGTLEYVATYGPPSGTPRYRRTHKIGFALSGIDVASGTYGSHEYFDMQSETDEII